jgi:hypothetical protein
MQKSRETLGPLGAGPGLAEAVSLRLAGLSFESGLLQLGWYLDER